MEIDKLIEKGIHEEIIEILKVRGITKLDQFQEDAINEGLLEGKNLLISAPTSSGKTLIGELALVKHACKYKGCFYVVSHKALAEEKYRLFSDTYEANNWFNVAITTGDRSRFDEDLGSYGVIIATYEKLSNLIISNPDLLNSVDLVVIDEIQILGDLNRGSTLETLLIKLKSKSDLQIICLSATISNPDDLSEWLNCKPIICNRRSIDLEETLWCTNKIISKDFNTKIFEEKDMPLSSLDTIKIIKHLKETDHFPVIVFAMTKNVVEKLANDYSIFCEETKDTQDVIRNIKDASEGTPTSKTLCNLISKGIGIHTTDLTDFEKEMVETAFANGQISIVFSTTTLSTGINLPAKTVLIDKCRREWPPYYEDIAVHEYINISGRAGRRGLQEKGTSIIKARDKAEEIRFSKFLDHDLQEIKSQLIAKKSGFGQHILSLISSGVCNTKESIWDFFKNSFLNFTFQKNNEMGHIIIEPLIDSNIEFLLKNNFIMKNPVGNFEITQYGRIVVEKGIRPETFLHLKAFLDHIKDRLTEDNFNNYIPQIIYSTTLTEEFIERRGIIYARGAEERHFKDIMSSFNFLNLKEDPNNFKTAYILKQYIERGNDEEIYGFSYVTHGKITTTAELSSWMIGSISDIAQLSDYNFSGELIDKFITLELRAKFGVTEDAVSIRNIFFEEQIKGVGRSISMKLAKEGIVSLSQLVDIEFDDLSKIIGPKHSKNIRDGIIRFVKNENHRLKMLHENRLRKLGFGTEYLTKLYTTTGREFEEAVYNFLKSINIQCKLRDVGEAEAEPDILIFDKDETIPVECKTKKDDGKSISNSEAFDILAKGFNYNKNHLMTVGKPLFSKAAIDKNYKEVTLLLHSGLAELIIKVLEGDLTKEEVMQIFKKGGYIKIEQISPEFIYKLKSYD